MFLGTFQRNIDNKNRVIIPPKLREALGDKFFITIGSEKNLEIRAEDEFHKFIAKIDQNNTLDPLVKKYRRYILGNTVEVAPDKLGRFTLSEQHLKPTSIDKEVVFVGVGNHIELWSSQVYENANIDFEDDNFIGDITDELFKKGYKL